MKPQRATTTSDEQRRADRLRATLLGAMMSIYVARPLLVSESAATVAGDGLLFAVLTLLLAAVWWFAAAFRPGLARRFGGPEWAWIALLVWQFAGTLVAVRTGWARAAINVGWEWVGLGLGFILLRQLIASDRELRAILAMMIVVAVVLSGYGLFQFYVSLPAMREEFRLHPDQVLRAAGVVAPPGSPARLLFQERLRSTEPMATFALANSFAGFLVPWLLMVVGALWLAPLDALRHGSSLWRRATAAAAALSLAVCLVLTKSRTAYAATLLGLAAIAIQSRLSLRESSATFAERKATMTRPIFLRRYSVLVGALLLVVLLAMALGGKSLDRQIFTEAAKSLSYRGHYWQAALEMIGDYPWFGCGLGNFQDLYTQYKLPEASEVVADPHNFLLEVGATSGTPALLAFLAIFVGAAIELRRSRWVSAESGASRPTVCDTRTGVYLIFGGAAAGFVLAFFDGLFSTVGLPIELLAAGLVAVAAAASVGWRWIECGPLPRALPLIAVTALLINLIAAGGIAFAGVAGSLWLLLAVATCAGRTARPVAALSRGAALVGLAASLILAVVCLFSAYLPVLKCRVLLAEAEAEPRAAEQRLRKAAQADPLADQPWKDLAELRLAQWGRQHDDRILELWEHAQREVLRRRPRSSAAWHHAGEGYFAIYRQTGRPRELAKAIEHDQRAVELYPNQALARAHFALALAAAGRMSEARSEASKALQQHQLTPHADQKLSDELVAALQPLASTGQSED